MLAASKAQALDRSEPLALDWSARSRKRCRFQYVVSDAREAKRLVECEPGVVLAFRQDKVLIKRRPLTVKVVPTRTVIVGTVAQRHDVGRIERDPKLLVHLAAPRSEEVAAILRLASPTKECSLPRIRGRVSTPQVQQDLTGGGVVEESNRYVLRDHGHSK